MKVQSAFCSFRTSGKGRRHFVLLVLLLIAVCNGCLRSASKLHYLGRKSDGDYYKERATTIDFPVDDGTAVDDSAASLPPRRIREFNRDAVWDLRLAEAIHLALSNATILKVDSQFLSPQNVILANPDIAPSVYDPALQETGVQFGRRGVEAALADFDAQFATNMLWGRGEEVQNNAFLSGGLPPGDTLINETGGFTAQLQKQMATGGRFAVRHDWNYSGANVPTRLFSSVYTGLLQAEYRHPLLAGAGTEFNRVAGPLPAGSVALSNPGIVIARIDNDLSLADFEANVQLFLRDVESAYWDLYLMYRTYDAQVAARNAALGSWREVSARAGAGAEGGGAADEAQARESYFDSGGRAQNALADLYATEGRLRRLLGLPVNDGRVIRPADEPMVAEFQADWRDSLTEALTSRVELRRQNWNIKKLSLQLTAAHSLARPRFDFVSNYQVNGFGDRLLGNKEDVTGRGLGSAYGTLTGGNQTGWNLGFEFSAPIGFRLAHAQIRNLELQLAKARAVKAAQELEISHELSAGLQNLDRWYATAQTNFNRRLAAETRLNAYEAEYRAGRTNLDLVLRSQISLAEAHVAYFRSLVEYNKTIVDVHFRKGTLLAMDNIQLAESSWEPEAYADARRYSRARDYAFDAKFLTTEPAEFARPAPAPAVLPPLLPLSPVPVPELPPLPGDPPMPAKPKGPVAQFEALPESKQDLPTAIVPAAIHAEHFSDVEKDAANR